MTSSERPSFGEKISFGFGDLASVLYWQTFMAYLVFFYTDVFGITAAAAGTMIAVSRILDGIVDPVVGMLADRTNTRWGKFRPYLLWLCVPFALTGVLTFTTPAFGPGGKLVWAYATYITLMVLYTAINIPYTAMLGVISPNSDDRTQVSSIKFLFAFGAGTLVSATLLPMAKAFGGKDAAHGWQMSFVVYGIAATIFFLITFFGTRERVTPPEGQKTSIGRDLKDLFTNGPWVILLLTTITFILFIATRMSVTTHYFKYYVGHQHVNFGLFQADWGFEALVSTFNTLGQACSIGGVLLVAFISRALGKKRAFVTLYVISLISTAAFYFLKPHQVGIMFLLQGIGSAAGAPLSALIWAMYADTADYSEWRNGRRATGLVFSASTMSQKFGWAIGALAATQVMSLTGFVPNVAQTPETLNSLVLLVSLIPAGLGLLSLIPLSLYKLDEATMSKISAELAERRAQGAPTQASPQL
jgi:GPH family glycoside/pentoside/hexuronide:cation symporter